MAAPSGTLWCYRVCGKQLVGDSALHGLSPPPGQPGGWAPPAAGWPRGIWGRVSCSCAVAPTGSVWGGTVLWPPPACSQAPHDRCSAQLRGGGAAGELLGGPEPPQPAPRSPAGRDMGRHQVGCVGAKAARPGTGNSGLLNKDLILASLRTVLAVPGPATGVQSGSQQRVHMLIGPVGGGADLPSPGSWGGTEVTLKGASVLGRQCHSPAWVIVQGAGAHKHLHTVSQRLAPKHD